MTSTPTENTLVSGDHNNQIISALQDMSKTLGSLVKRVQGSESELKKVKQQLNNSSSSTRSVSKKIDVPLVVRVSAFNM